MATEPLLKPDEVASYLQVPKGTLYVWRHRGEGPPALRVGRHLRYRKETLDRWLEEQAQND